MTGTRRKAFGIVVLSAVFASAALVSLDASAAKKKKKSTKDEAPAAEVQTKDTSPQSSARDHYNKGKTYYDQGKFAESLTEFQAAYDAKPHPTVLKSIAECLVQIGNIPEAIATLEKFLADPASPDKETVQKRLDELKQTPVKISVSSSLTGTKFSIEGVDGEFTAPADVDLAPGDHRVTFKAEGYEPLVKSVTVVLGQPMQLAADFSTEGVPVAAPAPTPVEPAPVEQPKTPASEVKDESGPPVAFWAMAAVAGVGLISGTVFGTMALSMEDDYEEDPTPSKKESGQRDALIADVSFGVAAAAAIAGTVVFVVHKKKSKHPETASRLTVVPVASPETVGMSAAFRF